MSLKYFISKNKIILIIFIIVPTIAFVGKLSAEQNINFLRDGKKVIFIRHALAPGNGDPSNFDLANCATQRNLNKVGIEQSRNIGVFFTENKIKIDLVLSSQWCRCKDTARYAFKNYKEFSALNSTYQASFAKNEAKQLKIIKNFVNAWDGKEGNLILVTHYSIITAITDAIPRSGEIVITDKQFKVLGTHLIQ